MIPTVFVCMVALNVAVWANSRINYVFIFGMVTLLFMGRYTDVFTRVGCAHEDGSSRSLRGNPSYL
jgi:hypothetical protein